MVSREQTFGRFQIMDWDMLTSILDLRVSNFEFPVSSFQFRTNKERIWIQLVK